VSRNKRARTIFNGMTLRPNRGLWSEDDVERLRGHIERGGSAARTAVMFKRTEAAVKAKALEIGLKFPTIRQLRHRVCGDLSAPADRSLWSAPDPSPEPQRKLSGRAGVEVDKLRERARQFAPVDVGSALELGRELIGNVARPLFARVEADDANGVMVLAGVEILQRGLSIALRAIGLSVDSAQPTEVILYDVNRFVC
jgi:hypothetical protein